MSKNSRPRPNKLAPAEQTLAALVRAAEPTWSWSKCREMIAAGRVLVDGLVSTDAAARFAPEMEITISAQRAIPRQALPAIHVYFYDSQLIVVEKPSGIESVPFETKSQDSAKKKQSKSDLATLTDLARQWLELKEKAKLPPLRTVHRIDKGTSGIVVFARTQSAERNLNQQFRAHSIQRHYLAITMGEAPTTTIRSVLIEDRGDGFRGSRPSSGPLKSKDGKDAVTHVKILEKSAGYSLVECRIETGRTHQIRIHLSELGHPLCGDTVYRKPHPGSTPLADKSGASRLMLHAAELGFSHPSTGENVHFASLPPAEFADFWLKLTRH